jgi:hypothetical protein
MNAYRPTAKVKDIIDIENETASYELLPLGNSVYTEDGKCLLSATLHPSYSLVFYL